jgi:feruloyl-CoA synthase
VVFNGRVAEDFKLTSGTWVSVGMLRIKVVSALAPYAQDVVITGHDRSEIGALVFLTEAGRAAAPRRDGGRICARACAR